MPHRSIPDLTNLKRYWSLLEICRDGTPEELLAFYQKHRAVVQESSVSAVIMYLRARGFSNLSVTPLAGACEGNNVENVKLLLQLGEKPDLEEKATDCNWGPAYIYGIGKPQVMKLFFPDEPWWKGKYAEETFRRMNLQGGDDNVKLPEPEYVLWCLMRGVRLETPKLLLADGFYSLPAVMQEFICRFGIRRENLASYRNWLLGLSRREFYSFLKLRMDPASSYRNWLTERNSLLEILRRAEAPSKPEWRSQMEKLLLSNELLPKEAFLSLVDGIFSPHDLISVLEECHRGYDSSQEKPFLENTMELIFSVILNHCDRQ